MFYDNFNIICVTFLMHRIQKCHYCKKMGASIGCCKKFCRRSFHLPCAIANDCQFQFVDTYKSFCHSHNNIETPQQIHENDQLCSICWKEMGEYHETRSIQTSCCKNELWSHKRCFLKATQTTGFDSNCASCGDIDEFQNEITRKGIFIPNR